MFLVAVVGCAALLEAFELHEAGGPYNDEQTRREKDGHQETDGIVVVIGVKSDVSRNKEGEDEKCGGRDSKLRGRIALELRAALRARE